METKFGLFYQKQEDRWILGEIGFPSTEDIGFGARNLIYDSFDNQFYKMQTPTKRICITDGRIEEDAYSKMKFIVRATNLPIHTNTGALAVPHLRFPKNPFQTEVISKSIWNSTIMEPQTALRTYPDTKTNNITYKVLDTLCFVEIELVSSLKLPLHVY